MGLRITAVILLVVMLAVSSVALANQEEAFTGQENTLDQAFTDEELGVLRQLAQKLINIRNLWTRKHETVERPVEDDQKVDTTEELFLPYPIEDGQEETSRSSRRYEVPSRDQIKQHFSEVMEGVSETAKEIVQELKVVGSEWMDEQKDMLKQLWESVNELRTDVRGILEDKIISETEVSPTEDVDSVQEETI